MRSLSALVPRSERSLVRAQARRLDRRVARQPGQSPRLRRRVCQQVAAIAPRLGVDQLALLVRHTLWSYRLDDRLDASGADLDTLARVRDELATVTTGRPPGAPDPGAGDSLASDLADIVAELSGHDLAGEVPARYGEVLQDAVAAEVDQVLLARAVVSGAAPPPTAEQYLELAARTVNYRSFTYVLLAVGSVPLTAPQLACLDPPLWHAAYAVRLGNDLRSLDRDDAGTSLNVLRLRTAAGAPVTEQYVRDEIDRRVQAHEQALQALARLDVIPAPPALALIRCLRQVVRLYRRTDLR